MSQNKAPQPSIDLTDHSLYRNRELSWLEFNRRVLEEAQDPDVPLLERLKFLSIFSSNLDEFFMVRIAGLKELLAAGIVEVGPDGLTPEEQLARIFEVARALVAEQYRTLNQDVLPKLRQEGIVIHRLSDLPKSRRKALAKTFMQEIAPVLTPLAIDPAHPFPQLSNGSLNLAIVFDHDDDESSDTGVPPDSAFALVQVPSGLPRLIPVGSANYSQAYVMLEDIIAAFVGKLFVGLELRSATAFRVMRNSDLVLDEEDIEDLLQTIAKELRQRDRRRAVRLEVAGGTPAETLAMLQARLGVDSRDIYEIDGPVDLTALMTIYKNTKRKHLKDPPFNPRISQDVAMGADIFSVLRERDVLLRHPYESFSTVVELLQSAADDPNVLAIKQTLYRTAGDSPIIAALIQAAEAGKQVTAMVELRARFDERNNIRWARTLERAGVHVVYGLMGLKTHCKAMLVVRREPGGLRRYVHLGTGNYNSTTARLYTDMGLLSADRALGEDVSALFNLLTGFNAVTGSRLLAVGAQRLPWNKLLVAPMDLHRTTQRLIEAEIALAEAGRPARIVAKMNSLVDPATIKNLYRASRAGVRIDLIVRGICCLRPGVPGASENIRVISILDRFLEHDRIFYFLADGAETVMMGSADWMPRNFFRRIEALFPINDPRHKARILKTLERQLADNVKARVAQPDTPTYARKDRDMGEPALRCQSQSIQQVRDSAIKSLQPYEETIRDARSARLKGTRR